MEVDFCLEKELNQANYWGFLPHCLQCQSTHQEALHKSFV